MKLKEALKIAEEKGYSWVAVDANFHIYAYAIEPQGADAEYRHVWMYSSIHDNPNKHIGYYTGNKHWTKTLREVK